MVLNRTSLVEAAAQFALTHVPELNALKFDVHQDTSTEEWKENAVVTASPFSTAPLLPAPR